MLKIIISFFLIFSVALRPLMPLMDYTVNYNYISTILCENRSKPELLCNGKCYLKKEIAKTADSQSKNETRMSLSGVADFFIVNENFAFTNLIYDFHENSDFNSELNFSYSFNLFANIFHPPLV